MKQIVKYVSDDGLEFDDADDCEEHEQNCILAEEIMSALPKRPHYLDFYHGEGYIQHDAKTFLRTRNEFLQFAKRYTDHSWIQETIDGEIDTHASWAARILDECAPKSITEHWYRFCCTDLQLREWGQPYFALNPDKGVQIRLNDDKPKSE